MYMKLLTYIAQFLENNLQCDSLFLKKKQEVEDANRKMSQRNEKKKMQRGSMNFI